MDFESLFRDELGDLIAADDVDYVSQLLGDEWVDAIEALDDPDGEEIALNGQELEINPLEPSQKKRKKKTNPNKAREQRRAELENLRREVGDLEFILKRIQTMYQQHWSPNLNQINCSKRSGGDLVWRDACIRQMQQRLRVERENSHLKNKYKKSFQVLKSLEDLVYKRPALWVGMYSETCNSSRRIEVPTDGANRMTSLIFDELSAGVEVTYRAVKSAGVAGPTGGPVLTYDMDNGRIETVDCTIVPFGMIETGEAWWQDWHNYRGHRAYESIGDVVKESFGQETVDFKTKAVAIFYAQQILHRRIEDHRVVYVWDTYMEPIFFKSKRITGVYFREQCYVVIEPVQLDSAVNKTSCTQLSTREVVTTHFLDPKLKKDATITSLTKFYANSMPPYMAARNNTIASLLLDTSLKQCRGGG